MVSSSWSDTNSLLNLPQELIFIIFDYMNISDLSYLAVTSKSLRDLVDNYCISSKMGYKYLFPIIAKSLNEFVEPRKLGKMSCRCQVFRDFGTLVKRVTCLYPTIERLNIALNFLRTFSNLTPSPNEMEKNIVKTNFYLTCFGIFFEKMIAGWDENECITVFDYLDNYFKLRYYVKDVLSHQVGTQQAQELFVRNYYRYMYLDLYSKHQDKIFWLSLILKRYERITNEPRENMTDQCKVLLLLYGPLLNTSDLRKKPCIAWYDMTQFSFTGTDLKDLGIAIHLLHYHPSQNSLWTDGDIIKLVNTMINIPIPWSEENVSSLLYFCGNEVVQLVIKDSFNNGYINNVANYIVYLALISSKLKASCNWILEIIDACCASKAPLSHKVRLISLIPDAFFDAVRDIEQPFDMDDDIEMNELDHMMNTQRFFMQSLLSRIYPYFFYSRPNAMPFGEKALEGKLNED